MLIYSRHQVWPRDWRGCFLFCGLIANKLCSVGRTRSSRSWTSCTPICRQNFHCCAKWTGIWKLILGLRANGHLWMERVPLQIASQAEGGVWPLFCSCFCLGTPGGWQYLPCLRQWMLLKGPTIMHCPICCYLPSHTLLWVMLRWAVEFWAC